jgi:hypothetical protein
MTARETENSTDLTVGRYEGKERKARKERQEKKGKKRKARKESTERQGAVSRGAALRTRSRLRHRQSQNCHKYHVWR